MLILVGVTINVALNGGLFTQAQEASKNTQIQADKEQLLSAIVASYDIETGTIKSKSELEKNLGEGWTVEEEGSVYKVTSPKGNVFTVDAKGNIDGDSKKSDTPEGDDDTETPNFYGVAYKGRPDLWVRIYFFKDGNLLWEVFETEEFSVFKYVTTMPFEISDEGEISVSVGENTMDFGTFTEDFSSFSGGLWKSDVVKRDNNDVIDWSVDEAPVIVSLKENHDVTDVGTGVTLSYREYQAKGTKYETTILIDEGNRSITDYNVTITLYTQLGKQYTLNEDYLYDEATGTITISNLNEAVILDVEIREL